MHLSDLVLSTLINLISVLHTHISLNSHASLKESWTGNDSFTRVLTILYLRLLRLPTHHKAGFVEAVMSNLFNRAIQDSRWANASPLH